jgi:hypothetical protein
MTRGRSRGFTSENGKKGGLGIMQGWLTGYEERPEYSGCRGFFSPDFHHPHSHGYQDLFFASVVCRYMREYQIRQRGLVVVGGPADPAERVSGGTVPLKGIDGCGGKGSESPPRLMVCFIRKSKKRLSLPFSLPEVSSLPVPGTKDEPGSASDLRSLAGCRMRSGLSNFVGRVTGRECENDPGCA